MKKSSIVNIFVSYAVALLVCLTLIPLLACLHPGVKFLVNVIVGFMVFTWIDRSGFKLSDLNSPYFMSRELEELHRKQGLLDD